MTTLFMMGLTLMAMLFAVVLIPFVLVKVALGLTFAILAIPVQIFMGLLGALLRGLAKGAFWLAVILIPLAIVALPFTILAFFGWLVYRMVRPRRVREAYVVS